MNHLSQTPFDNIESALEYIHRLLEATREAKEQIEAEILRAATPQRVRRKQALQLGRLQIGPAFLAPLRKPPHPK
jgi:hypothetical protein